MIKALLVLSLAFGISAQAAETLPMSKHKNLPCATCHQNGISSHVSYQTCQGCHPVSQFPKEIHLKNGKPNPHVTIHYDPEMVDCVACHKQHKNSVNYCEACHSAGFGLVVP